MALLASCASTPTPESRVAAEALSQAATLSAVCSGCHGSERTATAIVSLNGYTAERIRSLLEVYKAAGDGQTAMHRMARGYTDEQITAIAEYVANERR